MTGAAFELTFDDAAILGALDRVEASLVESSPLLQQLGEQGVKSTQQRFDAQAGPDGTLWPGLSPAYERLKDAEYGAGFNILYVTGAMRNELHWDVSPGEVRWGSSRPYAAVHQFGATIVPKNAKALAFYVGAPFQPGRTSSSGKTLVLAQSVTIPARPYLGLNEEDKAEITALARDYLRALLINP